MAVKKEEEIVATELDEPEEGEPLEEEEEEEPEIENKDDEVDKHPEKLELRQVAKPSNRKPLPRRPRTPSVSPPGSEPQRSQLLLGIPAGAGWGNPSGGSECPGVPLAPIHLQ